MKKMRFFLCVVLSAAALWSCGGDGDGEPGPEPPVPPVVDPNAVEVVNSGFEKGLEGWTRVDFHNGGKVTVEVVEGAGVNDSRCIKIQQFPENGRCGVGIKQKLTGLEPDQMYRMYAKVKYSDIPQDEGRGAILFDMSQKQFWGASKFLYGTNLRNWTSLHFDFLSQDDGTAEIVCSLGFRYGGTTNGGYSTGTAYFDNVSVVKVTDELFMQEGEHIRLFVEPSQVYASASQITEWIANLDRMYESYADLVGATPHEGRKLAILSSRGLESGYWALAGYPIPWSSNYSAVTSTFEELAQHGTWSFGLMHELGHVFNLGNSSWNWNDEMFANFRMQYGLEQNQGKVWMDERVYTGREILDMYKKDYDNTVYTQVNDNGIHYMLGRLAGLGGIGWEPFKAAFRELTTTGGAPSGKYDKFEYLLSLLSKHATRLTGRDVDVRAQYFTEAELASIRKQLQ